jgi:hypothetical protein
LQSLKAESFYLAFKQLPPFQEFEHVRLKTADEVYEYIKTQIPPNAAILLSAGRDSAILASLMPKGTLALTARCATRRDESIPAKAIAERCGLRHRVITITKQDYLVRTNPDFQLDPLKFCPWNYKLAKEAKKEGYEALVTGVGTLAYFGEDAQFHDYASDPDLFFRKWAVIWPEDVLKYPYPIRELCKEYVEDGRIDTARFMSLDRGARVIQNHTLGLVGLKPVSPYFKIQVPLDVERAKKEGKYLLGELYEKIFGMKPPPKRTPSVMDYDAWLKGYRPLHPNFRDDMPEYRGIRKWQLYKLQQYWRKLEEA